MKNTIFFDIITAHLMKKKLLLLFILLVIFSIFIFLRYFTFNKQAEKGNLQVISSPNASVFLDNVAVGRTPFEMSTSVGEHILKLIPEGVATQTASWQGKININRNSLTFVERDLAESDLTSAGIILTVEKLENKLKGPDYGAIEIETEPTGASVSLDNDEKGISPLILADVIKGEHELSVFSPGFFRRSAKINVEPGYKVVAQFKLALDPSQESIDSIEKEQVATESSQIEQNQEKIRILQTSTGWLRVRSDATLNSSESARVDPGQEFAVLEEKNGWIKIEYEKDNQGWVSAQYTEKVTDETPATPTP